MHAWCGYCSDRLPGGGTTFQQKSYLTSSIAENAGTWRSRTVGRKAVAWFRKAVSRTAKERG